MERIELPWWIFGYSFLHVVTCLYYFGRAIKPQHWRCVTAVLLLLYGLVTPVICRSENLVATFYIACMHSLLAMYVVDFLLLRSAADMKALDIQQYFVTLAANLDEKAYRKLVAAEPEVEKSLRMEARLANTHAVRKALLKLLMGQLFLFIVPLPSQIPPFHSHPLRHIWSYDLCGWTAYLGLSSGMEIITSGLGLIFDTPVKPVFNRPYLATSPRDLWSRRWNLLFRDVYHHILFSQKLLHSPAAKGAVVFLLSGLIHEYLNFCAFEHFSGLNLAFFCIHGAAVFLQVSLKQRYPGFVMRIPTALAIILNHLFFAVTSPLYFKPYVQAGFFQSVPKLHELFGFSLW